MTARHAAVLVARLLAATMAMFICIALAAAISGAGGTADSQDDTAPILVSLLLMCLISTLVLAFPTLRSHWHGLKLTATVFLLLFGVQTFMSQIETLYFAGAFEISGAQMGSIFQMGALTALFYSPVLVLILGKWRRRPEEERPERRLLKWGPGLLWRAALLPAVYLCLYMVFGYFIAWQSAAVRTFYSGSAELQPFFLHLAGLLQSDPWLFPWQLLRGLFWLALALPVILMMKGRRWEVSLALGLLFGVLLTIPTIMPNPLMPANVRLVHFVETSTSTFIYGWLIGWLLGTRSVGRHAETVSGAPLRT